MSLPPDGPVETLRAYTRTGPSSAESGPASRAEILALAEAADGVGAARQREQSEAAVDRYRRDPATAAREGGLGEQEREVGEQEGQSREHVGGSRRVNGGP